MLAAIIANMTHESTRKLSLINALLLFSAIIPATILFGLSIFILITITVTSQTVISLLSIFMGIMGYIGLISCISDQSRRSAILTAACLGLGILGFSIFIFMEGGNRFLEWVLAFKEKGEIFLVLWPLIVSTYFLVYNLRLVIDTNYFSKTKL